MFVIRKLQSCGKTFATIEWDVPLLPITYLLQNVPKARGKEKGLLKLPNFSARSSYSKLEFSMSFNPQNSNWAKLQLKKLEKLVCLEPKLEILELDNMFELDNLKLDKT